MHCSFDILHLWHQRMCGNRSWHIYAMHSVLSLKSGVTLLNSQFLVRQWGFRPRVSFFVLNAKGKKIKTKATRSAATYAFQKVLCFELVFFIKTLLTDQNPLNIKRSPLIAKLLSCREETFIMGKGGALGFWSKLVLIYKTKVFLT